MPLALVTLAAFLILVGIKGNYAQVGSQFQQDVMGQGGYFQFLAGILGIAIFFRLIGMPNAGRVFLILVILVYLMQNKNVLSALENLSASSGSTPSAAPAASGVAYSP